MKKILKIFIIGIILLIISLPVYAKSGKVINTDEVRFREKASATEDSKVLGKIPKGSIVEILEKKNGWYKVQYNGETGYINASYLEEVEQTTLEPKVPEKTQEQVPPEELQQETNKTENTQLNNDSNYKTTERVHIRIMPLINSSIILSINKGENCTLITTAGNWSYIETPTIKGWVINSKIEKTDISATSSVPNTASKVGYVNLDSINVRKEPSTSAELVTKLALNTQVTITGEDGDWYIVELNGEKVYIFKELISASKVTTTSRSSDYNRAEATNNVASATVLESTNTNATSVSENNSIPVSSTGVTGQDVVEYAKQYLGYPYVYATAGPNSFDCSGFTSYVYKHFGYNISRSSSAQVNEGVNVEKANLQLGDIIIFNAKGKNIIGHVGIYIGNNQFIHASSSTTGVIISDLSSANYPERYVTARRILK